MRVLVTGGAGYVGGAVCSELAREHEVVILDVQEPAGEHGRYLRGSILSAADLAWATEGCQAVVHLAAIPHPLSDSPDRIMQVNVTGTGRVLEAAANAGVRRVVMASSDSAYGFMFGEGRIKPRYLPVDEAHPLRPRDPYGLSKLLGEEICRCCTRRHGVSTVCLRYCWVWSEEHHARAEEFAATPEQFVGQLWGYVDREQVARAVAAALTAEHICHETLLIAAPQTFVHRPTLELVEEYLPGIEVDEEWFEADPRRSCFDTSRAGRVLAI
jgi:UDP-glucose 4-epimerase